MLSGESTPLLKESIQLLEASEKLEVDDTRYQMGQSSSGLLNQVWNCIYAPCLGVIVRTGFGTVQGQLVRTMIFSTERLSANNLESFLFIGFLLIFAISAIWYVWTKGNYAAFLPLLVFKYLQVSNAT